MDNSTPPPWPAPATSPAATPGRKPRGCFFYAAITVAVLAVIFGVGGYYVFRTLMTHFERAIEEYTETAPIELPRSRMREEEYRDLELRVAAWEKGGEDVDVRLELTAEEVNALIQRHPGWRSLRDRVHVEVRGALVLAQISIPLAEPMRAISQFEKFGDRYLNGEVGFTIRYERGKMDADLQSLVVRDRELPQQFLDALREHGAFRGFVEQQGEGWQEKVERMWVVDGMVVVLRR